MTGFGLRRAAAGVAIGLPQTDVWVVPQNVGGYSPGSVTADARAAIAAANEVDRELYEAEKARFEVLWELDRERLEAYAAAVQAQSAGNAERCRRVRFLRRACAGIVWQLRNRRNPLRVRRCTLFGL